jgi:CubicO group peptidase (beta-lactamase class C family)
MEPDPRPLDALRFTGPDGRQSTLGDCLAETYTDGFMVLQRGRVLAERYDNGQLPDTLHIIFSVSKSLTSLLAGILVGQGRVDPDAPVTRYIPEAANSAYGDCRLRHVLDMTVSTTFIEDYLTTTGDYARYRRATAWVPDPSQQADLRSFVVTMQRGPETHGELYHYVSPNSDLLGWICERAAGRRYPDLISELLWQPMGAVHDAYVTVDRLGASRSAAGVCATLRDMAAVGDLMRCGGEIRGRQVVPQSWINDIRQNGDPAAWAKDQRASKLLPNGCYRSQWYNVGNESGAFFARGIYGQWIYIDPVAEMVIAKQSSQPLPVDDAINPLLLAAFDAVARHLER